MAEYITREECLRTHDTLTLEQSRQDSASEDNRNAIDRIRNHVPPVWAAIMIAQATIIGALAGWRIH